MKDINRMCLESVDTLKNEKSSIFSNELENKNAKYIPKFLSKLKNKIKQTPKLKLKDILKLSSKTIPGTHITVDSNEAELDADKYLKNHGFLK